MPGNKAESSTTDTSSDPDHIDEKTKKIIHQSKTSKKSQDRIHFFICLFLVGMSYVFYNDFTEFRKQAPSLGIKMRDLSDLYIIVGLAISLQLMRRLLDYVLRPRLEELLLTQNLVDLELRREKLTRQIFDSFYYFGVYFYGLYVASGIDFIPGCVGGAGECLSLGMYWPKTTLYEKMRYYVILQFAHHLHNLVYHTVSMKNVGNYFEMIVHHYAAVVSLFYSYFTNWEDYAFITLICHDLSDGFLNTGKVLRDLGYGNSWAINTAYLGLLFFWVYHRTYIIATCYFYKAWDYLYWKNPFPAHEALWLSVRRGVNFIIFNIVIIWILNIIWWVAIVKIGISKFVKKNEAWVSPHEGEIDAEEVRKAAARKASEELKNKKEQQKPVKDKVQ